jgi:hypothetical protein
MTASFRHQAGNGTNSLTQLVFQRLEDEPPSRRTTPLTIANPGINLMIAASVAGGDIRDAIAGYYHRAAKHVPLLRSQEALALRHAHLTLPVHFLAKDLLLFHMVGGRS